LRFYDRKKEKKTIISFARKTDRARIVVLTGRRRIGKTRLLLELFGEKAFHLLWKELPSFEGKKLENLVFKKIIEESPVDFNLIEIVR